MLRSMQLKSLNPHITCVLCAGYLVDATTIIECLHSFCRSCIVRYLETSFHCPVCDVEIHKTRPLLHIKPDRVLQDIVYKLVPGLCQDTPERKEQRNPKKTEEKCKPNGCPDVIDDPVCIQLEYYGRKRFQFKGEKQIFPTRYLRCSSKVTVGVLKKFLSIKFGIPATHQPEIVRSDEILDNHITMTELSRIYGLYAKSVLDVQYIFLPTKEDDKLKTEGQEAKKVKLDHLQQYRHNELQQLQTKRKRRRKRQTKAGQQSGMQPGQRKRQRIRNGKPKEQRQEQDSAPNRLMTDDLPQEKRLLCSPATEQLVNDGNESGKHDNHHQPEIPSHLQDVIRREQDRRQTTQNHTFNELQYEKEQRQNTPEDRQHHVDHRIEQTEEQQSQEQQSKENDKRRQHESVCDRTTLYQPKKHVVSAKNSTETENNKDKESLESFKISPPPLRSRNLANGLAESFACPPLWHGIDPTSL